MKRIQRGHIMNAIIDFTEHLQAKKHLVAGNLKASDWAPSDALEFASREIQESEAESVMVIWVKPAEPSGTGDKDVCYALANLERGDMLALLVNLLKRLVNGWF